jgi:hypothetical protein
MFKLNLLTLELQWPVLYKFFDIVISNIRLLVYGF